MIPINIGYGSTNDPKITTTQTAQSPNEVLITERGVFNTSNTNFNAILGMQNGLSLPAILHHDQKIEIIRNLIDDTYNIRIYKSIGTRLNDADEYCNVGVNNGLNSTWGGNNSPVALQLATDHVPENAYWEINHSTFDDIKLRDTGVLGLGTDMTWRTNSVPLYKYVISPQFETLPTNVDLNFNQVLHIATLKKMTITQAENHHISLTTAGLSSATPSDNNEFKVNLDYNHIYIKPEPLDRYHGNEILAKVYIKNDSELRTTYDYNFSKGHMKSTGLGAQTAEIYFELDEHSDEQLENTGAHLLGNIKSLDSLYYDYTDDEVKIGSTSDSIYGDIIPYNFSGDYTREINLPINAVFKDLNIRFHTNVEDPLLDPSDGIVNLEVSNSKPPLRNQDIPREFFDMNDIKIIREHTPSLHAMEGMLGE